LKIEGELADDNILKMKGTYNGFNWSANGKFDASISTKKNSLASGVSYIFQRIIILELEHVDCASYFRIV
jgi:hypothetical protein